MKLFERTGGYWIFYISAAYFLVGMWSIYKGADLVWLPPLYVFFLAMPFWLPPLGRSMNLDITWDTKMFDWFKKKYTKDGNCDCGSCPGDTPSNVVPFPEPKSVPKMPQVNPPKEKDPVTFYRLGLTDNNRVSFTMGHSEITMNADGCQQMIDQLAFFQSQLQDEEDDNDLP